LLVCVPVFSFPKPKELTVLFYAAGDEEEIHEPTNASLRLFERLHSLGLDSQINVVVQHDDTGNDPNYRYALHYVAKPTDRLGPDTPPVPQSTIDQWRREISVYRPFRHLDPFKYQERDSGNPVTLKDFLRWGVTAYPARHYILVMSGHSWGQEGIMQDFFVDGKQLDSSTLIRNYELRRVLEETYGELNAIPGEKPLIPEGKFDLLILDGCVFGQLDVLAEYTDSFSYFVGSTMETPFHSIPWDEVLEPYFTFLNQNPGYPSARWARELEARLLKPLVTGYVRAHVRGGRLIGTEHQIDTVEAMALRMDKLSGVTSALHALLDPQSGMPQAARDDWRAKRIPGLELIPDTDENADLWQVASLFSDYFRQQQSHGGDAEAWGRADQLALAFRDSLGVAATDPTVEPIRLVQSKAQGAWAHIQIDETVDPVDTAICLALKEFAMQNQWFAGIPLPAFHDHDGTALSANELDCDDLQSDGDDSGSSSTDRVAVTADGAPVDKLFGAPVTWASGVPAYLNQLPAGGGGAAARYLSVWIPGDAQGVDRDLRVRLSGTEEVTVEYVMQGNPLDRVTGADPIGRWKREGVTTRFPAYVASTRAADFASASNPGLMIAEAHSNGAYFKRGMGIFLAHQLHTDNAYEGGRIPIEWVHPTWTMEEYMDELRRAGETDTQKIQGTRFYRAHRISASLWPDFLFGPGDAYLAPGQRAQPRRARKRMHRVLHRAHRQPG
jgi:hypothetical protein